MEAPARDDARDQPAPEARLTALRWEIRKAGIGARFLRTRVSEAEPVLEFWGIGLIAAAVGGGRLPWIVLVGSVLFAVFWIVAGARWAGGALSAAFRQARRRALRRELPSLPAPELRAVLSTLTAESEQAETRSLARALLRDVRPATELSPIAPPRGNGAEVNPGS